MKTGIYTHGRPVVRGRDGMVSAAHPLAASAGARVLAEGGNAFDAIVATAATLNVAEPFMSGLAGLGIATLYTATDKEVRVIDFHPPVPRNFDPDRLTREETRDGANASGIPGNLAGWCELNRKLGTFPLDRLLAPAIRYAREGVPRSQFYVDMVKVSLPRKMQPEWRDVYLDGPDSDAVALDSVHRQPDLAVTLEAIAENGPGHLYGGPLGRRMIDHLQKLGGCMTLEDLESVEPVWEEAVSASYRGLDVHVPAPPAESFQVLIALALLRDVDFSTRPHLSADHLDVVIRAIRLAAEIRIRNNRCTGERLDYLLSEAYLAPVRKRLLDGEPITGRTEQFGDGPLEDGQSDEALLKGQTTSMSAIDREGNVICLTQSLGHMFGSGVVIPGTGVCMNDFMFWGDLAKDSPNRLSPGQRFGMCLAPSISLQDGEPALSLGTPGSYGILQTQVQAMVHHFDYGLDLQAAIDAPRARLWDGRIVHLENRVESHVVDELRARGHDVETTKAFSMQCGGMHAIRRDPATGVLNGAADSRRDGAAVPS
ncbi:MAG: gamma-glutamyltransferase family protein [Alphaproteobacteria bacterium]|nr:gamma-glutamyltransferase family protein [Alphaproteobacteria bacterium]